MKEGRHGDLAISSQILKSADLESLSTERLGVFCDAAGYQYFDVTNDLENCDGGLHGAFVTSIKLG